MHALVNVPLCPLYIRPETGSPLSDQLLLGMEVTVLEETAGFCLVRTCYRYEGYAPKVCLHPGGWWQEGPRRLVLGRNFCDLLPRPDLKALPLLTLILGSTVVLLEDGPAGWQKAALPDGREGFIRTGPLAPPPSPQLPEQALRRALVRNALRYRLTPYRWGGKTPLGIDCSGLCSMAYLLQGIPIHRDASLQEGFPLRAIPLDQAGPGDLLYFPGHMALYLGKGRYLHATAAAGTDGVTVNSLDPASPLYRPDLAEKLLEVGSYVMNTED